MGKPFRWNTAGCLSGRTATCRGGVGGAPVPDQNGQQPPETGQGQSAGLGQLGGGAPQMPYQDGLDVLYFLRKSQDVKFTTPPPSLWRLSAIRRTSVIIIALRHFRLG
jgi:hypothetical protein